MSEQIFVSYDAGQPLDWAAIAQRATDLKIAHDPTSKACRALGSGAEEWTMRVRSEDHRRFYLARVTYGPEGVMVGCSCPAGQHEIHCKHLAEALMQVGFLQRPAFTPLVSAAAQNAMVAVLTGGSVRLPRDEEDDDE